LAGHWGGRRFSDGRYAEVSGAVECAPVDLGEFVFGSGEADLESFDFAEPAFAAGFGYAGDQVVADLRDAGPLGGVGPVQGASQAAVLVLARGAEGASADPGGDLAALEVSLHFVKPGLSA
jgi:hypothetical protein